MRRAAERLGSLPSGEIGPFVRLDSSAVHLMAYSRRVTEVVPSAMHGEAR